MSEDLKDWMDNRATNDEVILPDGTRKIVIEDNKKPYSPGPEENQEKVKKGPTREELITELLDRNLTIDLDDLRKFIKDITNHPGNQKKSARTNIRDSPYVIACLMIKALKLSKKLSQSEKIDLILDVGGYAASTAQEIRESEV